jgi:hypothetical protein
MCLLLKDRVKGKRFQNKQGTPTPSGGSRKSESGATPSTRRDDIFPRTLSNRIRRAVEEMAILSISRRTNYSDANEYPSSGASRDLSINLGVAPRSLHLA